MYVYIGAYYALTLTVSILENKIFPRFWKLAKKYALVNCYELPRDFFRVFKECWMQI